MRVPLTEPTDERHGGPVLSGPMSAMATGTMRTTVRLQTGGDSDIEVLESRDQEAGADRPDHCAPAGVCPDGERPLAVADAYDGTGTAVCP